MQYFEFSEMSAFTDIILWMHPWLALDLLSLTKPVGLVLLPPEWMVRHLRVESFSHGVDVPAPKPPQPLTCTVGAMSGVRDF